MSSSGLHHLCRGAVGELRPFGVSQRLGRRGLTGTFVPRGGDTFNGRHIFSKQVAFRCRRSPRKTAAKRFLQRPEPALAASIGGGALFKDLTGRFRAG